MVFNVVSSSPRWVVICGSLPYQAGPKDHQLPRHQTGPGYNRGWRVVESCGLSKNPYSRTFSGTVIGDTVM